MNTPHTPTAIYKDPERYYREEVKREVLNRYNIAFEIFMAEQYSRIHYSELMDNNIDEPFASKQRLISWINDNTKGKEVRPGILTKYREEVTTNQQLQNRGSAFVQSLYFCIEQINTRR